MASSVIPPNSTTALSNPYNIRASPYYHHIAQTTGPTNTVFFAGQIGIAPDGSIIGDPVEQIAEAMRNLGRCLEAAGAEVKDIMKLTYYIVDYDHLNPRHRGPVMAFMGDHRPPTTLVPVTKLALPGIIFEIEATAAIPQHTTERVDVVVVGAGLSGLQTAVDLQKSGFSVKVLEARDRVGGKTWSRKVPVQGSVCDVGAAWINDTNQSRMFALAKRYALETVVQNIQGRIVVDDGVGKLKAHPYGQLLSDPEDEAAIKDVIRVRDSFEAACQKIDNNDPVPSGSKIRSDLDHLTFEDWIRSHDCGEDAVNALTIGTRALLGVEPCEISALYILDYCKSAGGYMQMRSDNKAGGQYLRVRQGTQSFSRGLANELQPGSILLKSPVRRIEQRPDGVRVMSARATVEATRVVISVPTSLYKEIAFDPPLPAEKLKLSESVLLGDYCKMILVYDRPWWRQYDLCGLSQSVHGPFAVTRDTSIETENHYSLTCFVTGKPAREWTRLSADERQKTVLLQIDKLFGQFAKVEQPAEVVEQIWKNEQWSQGAPCPVMGPGVMSKLEKVLRSPAGLIHFVGTEMAYEWKGYMEGAVRSGERGAQEVAAALTGKNS